MFHEIRVRQNGEEKWVSAEKWFNYMLKEYSKINYKGKMIDPYEDRVNKYLLVMWRKAHPNVSDVKAELEKARAWLLSNRSKAKKDFKRFANNWLASSKSLARSGANENSYDADARVDREIKQRRKYMQENNEEVATQDDIKNILKEGGWIK